MKELITDKGYKKLLEEYEYLVNVKRKEITENMKTQLSENSSLEENTGLKVILEENEFIEKQITKIDEILKNAQVIKNKKGEIDRVIFGSTVEIEDLDDETKTKYTIVGSTEIDLDNNKISYKSPFAQILLNQEKDEELQFSLNNYEKNFIITKIYIE